MFYSIFMTYMLPLIISVTIASPFIYFADHVYRKYEELKKQNDILYLTHKNIFHLNRKQSLPKININSLSSLSLIREHINHAVTFANNDFIFSTTFASDKSIFEAVQLSISNGKRLRAGLAMDVAVHSSLNFNKNNAIHDATEVALSLEYLHAASLIIDDMPHFDNDDTRRGQISTHKKYGPEIAQMAATSLSGLSLEGIIYQVEQLKKYAINNLQLIQANETFGKLIGILSNSISVKGAAGGQLAEMEIIKNIANKTLIPNVETIENIIVRKTVSLFEAAILSGWVVGTVFESNRELIGEQTKIIKEIAYHYGMAFQIADDIGDVEKDNENGHGNINIINIIGLDKAQARMEDELKLCKDKLIKLNLWSNVWDEAFEAAKNMSKSQ